MKKALYTLVALIILFVGSAAPLQAAFQPGPLSRLSGIDSLAPADEDNPLLWSHTWGTGGEAPTSISAAPDGNFYVTSGNLLIKFGPDGPDDTGSGELWSQSLLNSPGEYKVVVSRDGDVFVCGGNDNFSEVRKYDSTFHLLWSHSLASPDGAFLSFPAMSVDPSGNVYAAGSYGVGGETSANWDVYLIKFDGDGNQKWAQQIGTDRFDRVRSLAAAGNQVYLLGDTLGAFEGYSIPQYTDCFLAEYSAVNGTQQWVKQFGSTSYFYIDWAADAVCDSAGDVYITYQEALALYADPLGSTWHVRKYNDFGELQWSADLPDQPALSASIAVDEEENTYVSWMKRSSLENEVDTYYLTKYDFYGNLQWTKTLDTGGWYFPGYISTGQFGDIYLAGYGNSGLSPDRGVMLLAKWEGDSSDTDGDGLLDRWEKKGVIIDNKFIDLPAMGAKYDHKDIFVEVDWMTGQGIKPSALDRVIQAFQNAPVDNPDGTTGINLHVDCGPGSIMDINTGSKWGSLSRANEVPYSDTLGSKSLLGLGNDYVWGDFDNIKKANFDPSRAPIFHYCLFAHLLGGLGTTSGLSRGIGASDFIVSLGGYNNGTGGTALQQAGTFMHELGHNLGLRHGGLDDIRYKPNYLSVMNYAFQGGGLIKKNASGVYVNGNYDYSIFSDLTDLNESALDESGGITSESNDPRLGDYSTIYYSDDPASGLGPLTLTSDGQRPIDWNYNDLIDEDFVAANITAGPRGTADSDLSVLQGAEDWHRLVYKGGSIGQMGAEAPASETPGGDEITWEDAAAQPDLYSVLVTSPASSGSQPGGSAASYTFTVTNVGTEADTYNIEAASSAGWADLSGVPASVTLSPGASQSISIDVSVRAGTNTRDELTLKAVSSTSDQIWDIGQAVTLLQSSSVTEQQVTDLTTSYELWMPVISGDWVVWQDIPGGDGKNTITHARNLKTGEERQVASYYYSWSPDYNPVDISGTKIVYEHPHYFESPYDTSYGADIWVYDLNTNTSKQITSGVPCLAPKISGDRVVYYEDGDIYMYDLNTDNETAICVSRYTKGDPDISGDKIVWEDERSDTTTYHTNHDIYMYDLSTDTESPIVTNEADQIHVRIDGDRIVWEDLRNGGPNVYMYDLSTKTESRITTTTNPGNYANYYGYPDIDGNLIVWLDYRDGYNYCDIYMYDIDSGTQSVLVPSSRDLTNPYYRVATRAWPSIDGNRIIYGKQYIVPGSPSECNTNLYLITLTSAAETSLSTNPADPNADGWFTSLPEITLTPGAERASIFYQWDANTSPSWAGYSGPFTAPEGEHTLYYYSMDELGNTEAVKSQTFKVDVTPPQTNLSSTPSREEIIGNLFKTPPEITLSTGEEGSTSYYQWDGTDNASFRLYAAPVQGQEGEHTFYYYSTDAHGNAEPVQSETFNVDTTPDTTAPTTTLSSEPTFPEDGSPFATSPVVTLTDNETSVTYYQWDISPTGIPDTAVLPIEWSPNPDPVFAPFTLGLTIYRGSFLVPSGWHMLYYFSIDAAGNIEETHSQLFAVGSEKPSLTITASNQTKVYGTANPDLSVEVTGLIPGDTLESLNLGFTLNTTANANSPVGAYPVTLSDGLVSTDRYDPITYIDGTLTVTPAPLTVDAEDKTRVAGTANPAFTAKATGLVGEDSLASLDLGYTLSTTANASSTAGTYPITFSGGLTSTANYDPITYVDGVLTITSAPPSGGNEGFVYRTSDVSITVSSPATVAAGGVFTCQLNVQNAGPDTATSMIVKYTLPDSVTLVSASGEGWILSQSGQVLTFTRTASQGIGEAPVITIEVIAGDKAGNITNQTTVNASPSDNNLTNNTDAVTTTIMPAPSPTPTATVIKPSPTPSATIPPDPTATSTPSETPTATPNPTTGAAPPPTTASPIATSTVTPPTGQAAAPFNWWLIVVAVAAILVISVTLILGIFNHRKK